jgi:predicted ATPase/DNA-binding winged helix-turn-helix (wHTH) protein
LQNTGYRFGSFELQLDERRLLRSGTPVPLEPRTFDVLVALVENAGHLVTKNELFDCVWGKVIVEEAALQVQVSALRKILGRDAIRTVTGHGYRFVVDLARDAPTAFEAGSVAGPRHNVPHPLTSFIGRESEIAELKSLLKTTRLLTLMGAGGCGKTRLAIEMAQSTLEQFPDGAWHVELASLADPELVEQTVGTVFRIKEVPGKSRTTALTDHLAPKNLLLVLDNAEHVLATCAGLIGTVLSQCPTVTILVTSREALRIPGEMTYRVPSLSVPHQGQDTTHDQIIGCESVRLFVERAHLVRPHFAITLQNMRAVASICRGLDGIPLAVELAAARVRSMTAEEIEQRLDQRFSLLTSGSRIALPRHRTLQAMIDWSHDLLSRPEQALLCRVSIFSGGWTLQAAEYVCADQEIDRSNVLPVLSSLVDKSFVIADEFEGATRYRLLETVRQYAWHRLRERGGEAHWQRRHLAHFVEVAKGFEPLLLTFGQHSALAKVETEHDNLRVALAWSCSAEGDASAGLNLAASVWRFWWNRGYLAEGRAYLAGVLARAPIEVSVSRVSAFHGAGVLAWVQSDFPAARNFAEECVAMSRQIGDRQRTAAALRLLGTIASEQGDQLPARDLFRECLAINRESGDRRAIAASLNMLAKLSKNLRDIPEAQTLHEQALALRRELGDRWGIAASLANLAGLARIRGDFPAARTLAEESLALFREVGEQQGIAMAMGTLGEIRRDQGDPRSARALLKDSLAILVDRGDRRGIAQALESLAYAFTPDRPAMAARLWGAAESLRQEIGGPRDPRHQDEAVQQIAAARAASDDDAAFDLAWQEGRWMSQDEAVRHALDAVQLED